MKTPEDFAIEFMQHMKNSAEGKQSELSVVDTCLVEAATSIQFAWVLEQMKKQGKESNTLGAAAFIPQEQQ